MSPRGESAPSMSPRSLPEWVLGIVAAIIVAGSVVASVALLGPAISHLGTAGVAQETQFVELYFTNPGALPSRLVPGRPNLLSFTVVNRENGSRVYAFTVTVAGPHGSSIVDRGSLALGPNGSAVRIVDIRPAERHAIYHVAVTVGRPVQTIHFSAAS